MTARWAAPQKVDGASIAFGGDMKRLLPPMPHIPDEFHGRCNPWVRWQSDWFFNGLDSFPEPKEGIDGKAAMRHLAAIQGSFEPKHEHKMAAVAYLASLWLKEPSAAAVTPEALGQVNKEQP